MSLGPLSYGLGAAAYLVLTLLLLAAWRGRLHGGLLLLASASTALWAGGSAAFADSGGALPASLLQVAEVIRDLAWIAFLLRLLGYGFRRGESLRSNGLHMVAVGSLLVALMVIGLAFAGAPDSPFPGEASRELLLVGNLLLALAGLVLIEQLFRNTPSDDRWAIKYLVIALGAVFTYDLYLYADGLLFKSLDRELWEARGAVNALVVPLLAIAISRNPHWEVRIFVSRHVVFHSVAFLGSGLYLILMSLAGYFIRIYGGEWGAVVQTGFLFGAVLFLVALLFSGRVRTELRVFLAKHFYRNQYDYREEWLHFTDVLSSSDEDESLRVRVLRAVANIVESDSGVLWCRDLGAGRYVPVASWNMRLPEGSEEPQGGELAAFLREREWVIHLDEYRTEPEVYGGLDLPEWLMGLDSAWLLVPLMQQKELLGYIVLTQSSSRRTFDWEDADLLKTVGRQAASYLAVSEMSDQLVQARQFEAFNRLSAYVAHDLKNVAAQLSLVVSNAKRHRNNVEFLADAIGTVDNAAQKMNHMLAQLRRNRLKQPAAESVALDKVLGGVVEACSVRRPVPELRATASGLAVLADSQRLAAVLEHIVQNAQEATHDDGEVVVRLSCRGQEGVLEVQDTGVGMDEAFVRERLFRPFDTTKGSAGMGIGAYESREFLRGIGGEVEVQSKPGAGTLFRIILPVRTATEGAASATAMGVG